MVKGEKILLRKIWKASGCLYVPVAGISIFEVVIFPYPSAHLETFKLCVCGAHSFHLVVCLEMQEQPFNIIIFLLFQKYSKVSHVDSLNFFASCK